MNVTQGTKITFAVIIIIIVMYVYMHYTTIIISSYSLVPIIIPPSKDRVYMHVAAINCNNNW